MRCTLVGVISACVRIVENETKAEAFAGIYGKFGVDMIFTIGLVSAIIIRNVGKWRQRVCEVQLVGLPYYVAVWLCEYELIRERPVYDNAVFPCRIVVAGGVVLSVQSGVECGVGVQMRNCVGYGGSYVTEFTVYGPYVQSGRNFLVACGVVVVFVEIPVLVVVYLCRPFAVCLVNI